MQLLLGGADFAAGGGATREFESCLTSEPFIGVPVQLHQLARAQFCDVTHVTALRFAVSNFVDAPARAMDAAVFVTFACIAPVEHEHAAVRTVTEVHPAEPRIAGHEDVG